MAYSILQGVLTCVIAIIGFFLIVDFPEKSSAAFFVKFLTVKEADFVVARIELDRHDAIAEPFSLRKYLRAGLDLKVWGFATLFGCTTVSLYAIAYFLPIILRDGMGFGVAEAQCLTAPPYILAAIVMYVSAYYGDKYHIRGPFVIFCAVCGLVGLPLLGFVENVGVRYFGAFLATTAGNAAVPCIMTWQANNIRGQWKRALCSATLVGTGGIGGIIGSTVFRSQDSPGYRPGIIVCMGANGMMALVSIALIWKFHRANKRAESGGKVIEGLHGFRYTL
jgi:MFS family permease